MAADLTTTTDAMNGDGLQGLRVLLVEDELVLALGVSDTLGISVRWCSARSRRSRTRSR